MVPQEQVQSDATCRHVGLDATDEAKQEQNDATRRHIGHDAGAPAAQKRSFYNEKKGIRCHITIVIRNNHNRSSKVMRRDRSRKVIRRDAM